jgi:hypothetical protein
VIETAIKEKVAELVEVTPSVLTEESPNITAGKVVVADQQLDASSELPEGMLQNLYQKAESTPQPVFDQNTAFGRTLETSADVTGRMAGYRQLASLWQVELPQRIIEPVCQEVQATGLQCLRFSTMEELKRFNRPANLVLSHNGQLHRVTITEIRDGAEHQNVQIALRDANYEISINELRARWAGDGILFWRPGAIGDTLLVEGVQGSKVRAVRAHLDQALAVARIPLLESVQSSQFDLDMAQKVFALQSRFAIRADGRIGKETYLLMNELLNPNTTPTLLRRIL